MDIFLKITRTRRGDGGQFTGQFRPDDLCQVGVNPELQLSVDMLLDDFGAKKFSMPMTQRAPQPIMIFCHDFLTSKGPWEPWQAETSHRSLDDSLTDWAVIESLSVRPSLKHISL